MRMSDTVVAHISIPNTSWSTSAPLSRWLHARRRRRPRRLEITAKRPSAGSEYRPVKFSQRLCHMTSTAEVGVGCLFTLPASPQCHNYRTTTLATTAHIYTLFRESTAHSASLSELHHRMPPGAKICLLHFWLRNHEHNSLNQVMAESLYQHKILTWSTCDGTSCGLPYVVLACAFFAQLGLDSLTAM